MTWRINAVKAKQLSFAKLSVSIWANQQFCLITSDRLAVKNRTNSTHGLSLTTRFSRATSLAHCDLVLGKQLAMATKAMLWCQYKQLRVLEALHVPGLRVPNTLALLLAKRLLLIEFVPGNTIETLGLPDPAITT